MGIGSGEGCNSVIRSWCGSSLSHLIAYKYPKGRTGLANATVTLLKKGGRGVLVPGNLILTTAHCVEFTREGDVVLGDYFIEEIETLHGKLKVGPLAVEPVQDIAVLVALDDQVFYKEVDMFNEFC